MILGLTGKNGSGKGEVAKFLQERGFQYYSLSDVLREEARKQGKEVTREVLIVLGNELRAEHGSGALAEKIISWLDPEKHYVIDSIRHPSEVKVLKRRHDFVLARVDAPAKIRFERIVQRGREKDPQTFQAFEELEKKEASSQESTAEQLDGAIEMADITIDNSGPIENLHVVVKDVILDLLRTCNARPGWDDYFMGIAKVVALRSNCLKRKVAAVIVKDQRIISTGYNGTPRGIENCNEGGCPRCNSIEPSGKGLSECLCSHAEENAIVQSAYHGVAIKESVLYTTFSPCLMCTKMIINAGIRKVVFNVSYPMSEVPLRLLKEASIEIHQVQTVSPDSSGKR